MFDDINKKNANNQNSQLGGSSAPQGQPTASGSNLAQPIKPAPIAPSLGNEKPVEDIFSNTDKAPEVQPLGEKPAVFQPKAQQPASPIAPAGINNEQKPLPGDSSGGVKKIIIGAVVILIIALVGFAGYWVYSSFFKTASPVDENIITEEPGSKTDDSGLEEAAVIPIKKQPPENNTLPPVDDTTPKKPAVIQAQDSDQDGLSDEEEKRLGTNPRLTDSDDDGLFDREEVRVYKTDPLNSDTDGDGYLDGAEVRDGYDPKGSGKLLKID